METNVIFYNGVKISVEMFTPHSAREILDNHNLINRNVNKSHVDELAKNMVDGTWMFNGDTICFDDNGNLIDGQHRLHAIIKSNMPIPFLTCRGFSNEVIKTIDQAIKPRNLADLFKIANVAAPNNVSSIISRRFVIRHSSTFIGSNRIGGTSAGSVLKQETIYEKYGEYFAHKNFYDELTLYSIKLYKKGRLLKVSDIGGVYAYLYFDKHHSDDDIRGFFDRLLLTETDINVINLLREVLIKDLTARTPKTSSEKSCLLAKTWNYYIKNKNVKVLSYNRNTEGIIEFI